MNIKERNEILKSLNEGIDMLKSEGVYDARLRYEGIIKPAWAIDLYLDDSNMYIATTFSNLDDIVEIKGLEFAKNYIGKTISDVIEINFNHKTYRYYAMTRVSRILDRLVDALHKFDSDLKATYEITLLDATIMLYDINDDICGKIVFDHMNWVYEQNEGNLMAVGIEMVSKFTSQFCKLYGCTEEELRKVPYIDDMLDENQDKVINISVLV